MLEKEERKTERKRRERERYRNRNRRNIQNDNVNFPKQRKYINQQIPKALRTLSTIKITPFPGTS